MYGAIADKAHATRSLNGARCSRAARAEATTKCEIRGNVHHNGIPRTSRWIPSVPCDAPLQRPACVRSTHPSRSTHVLAHAGTHACARAHTHTHTHTHTQKHTHTHTHTHTSHAEHEHAASAVRLHNLFGELWRADGRFGRRTNTRCVSTNQNWYVM